MSRDERRLCVFFSAGATRYALDAVRVLEVARVNEEGVLQLSQHLPVRDLSLILGGDTEAHVGAGVVLDVSPTLALRVKQVDGVFDCTGLPRWTVQGRLVPLLAPAIAAAIEYEGRLVFELDADGAARGLPRQLKPLERHHRTDPSALVFTVQGERLAIPLHHVVQVIEAGAQFNRAPNAGSFLGVAVHRAQLCPVFTVGPLGLVQPFVVLFEVGGDLLGLSASQVEGVRSGTSLDGASVLDVGRMFS
ncbi:MAG: chemotaxis protein CheW [Archangium sp.]|nr:chemotaxis protein CheW [Archangium sp.]